MGGFPNFHLFLSEWKFTCNDEVGRNALLESLPLVVDAEDKEHWRTAASYQLSSIASSPSP